MASGDVGNGFIEGGKGERGFTPGVQVYGVLLGMVARKYRSNFMSGNCNTRKCHKKLKEKEK